MKNTFADFLDTLLTFLSISTLGIIAARYFTRDLTVLLVSGFTAGLCITALIGLLRNKNRLPKEKQARLTAAKNQFIFRTRDDSAAYVQRALSTRYTVGREGDLLFVGRTAVCVHLVAQKLSFATLAEAYAQARGKAQRLLFLTAEGAEKQAAETAAALPDLKAEIFAFDRVFALLQWLGCLPQEEIKLKRSARAGLKALVGEALSRGRAKHYLFASLLLLFGAMFLPFAVYYVVMASFLIVLAVLSRLEIVQRFRKK